MRSNACTYLVSLHKFIFTVSRLMKLSGTQNVRMSVRLTVLRCIIYVQELNGLNVCVCWIHCTKAIFVKSEWEKTKAHKYKHHGDATIIYIANSNSIISSSWKEMCKCCDNWNRLCVQTYSLTLNRYVFIFVFIWNAVGDFITQMLLRTFKNDMNIMKHHIEELAYVRIAKWSIMQRNQTKLDWFKFFE